MTENSFRSKLEAVLNQDAASVAARHRAAYDAAMAPYGTAFVLFGAGRLGRNVLARLRGAGVEPLAFSDNNAKLWGADVEGLKVYAPEDAVREFGKKAAFVVTVYTCTPVKAQLAALGVTSVSFPSLAWAYPDTFLPHGSLDLPDKIFAHADHVRAAAELWADDASRAEYLGQLAWRTSLDDSALPPHLPAAETYFPLDVLCLRDDEVFVDCGAFDGDSVADFLRRRSPNFAKVVAIEADPGNCARLRQSFAAQPANIRDRLTSVQLAVGAKRETVKFDATGTAASSVGAGQIELECAPLDEILADTPPTFIKMDIEGAEPYALEGAAGVIAKHKPALAVCVYHAQDHIWRIPLFLHSICPDYRFFLRRYSDECWEQVCYAVPPERLA
ncbi:MAG TPA: FkbM family methyltransferase [Candidatus Hydrogenedentes bacterium]|nr:FkbM family methyltransferase [Candidatus Hydrogenedentota bacterium]HOS01743.1 FkbM family methyltransferase [Candidatus Hydrogenedentota bacterium]